MSQNSKADFPPLHTKPAVSPSSSSGAWHHVRHKKRPSPPHSPSPPILPTPPAPPPLSPPSPPPSSAAPLSATASVFTPPSSAGTIHPFSSSSESTPPPDTPSSNSPSSSSSSFLPPLPTLPFHDIGTYVQTLSAKYELLLESLRRLAFTIDQIQQSSLLFREKISTLEAENDSLKQQLARVLSEKEHATHTVKEAEEEKEPLGSTSSLAFQVKELQEKLDVSVKSWADIVKNPSPFITSSLREKERRDAKSLNVRVTGISFEGKDLLAEANAFVASTFGVQGNTISAAWVSKLQPTITFLKFSDTLTRQKILRKRGCLKGSTIFVSEDLTALQWEERKKLISDACARGQKVLFRDGRPVYVSATPLVPPVPSHA